MILGISGKKRAGKDTLADLFVKKDFEKINLADKLKAICAKVFNIDLEEFYNEHKDLPYNAPLFLTEKHLCDFLDEINKIKPIKAGTDEFVLLKHVNTKFSSHRNLLQYMGTDIARKCIYDDIWLIAFKQVIKDKPKVVCADARFANERSLIKDLDGVNILVKKDVGVFSKDSHESENDLGTEEEYDTIFDNNGSMSELTCSFSLWYDFIFKTREDL